MQLAQWALAKEQLGRESFLVQHRPGVRCTYVCMYVPYVAVSDPIQYLVVSMEQRGMESGYV